MALYFRLNHESDDNVLLLEQEIDAYIGRLQLTTAVDLAREVEVVLGRIPPDRNNTTKRELARALGEGSVQPDMVKDQIIKQFVRPSTFYNRDKSWLHDPEYRKVIETVIKLHRLWDSGRAARELADKQNQWRTTLHDKALRLAGTVDEFLESAAEIMRQPLYETVVEQDGETIKLVPGKWTQDTANRRGEAAAKMIETADKLARLALDMPDTPTESHIITADVSDGSEKVADVRQAMKMKLDAMRNNMLHAGLMTAVDTDDEEE